jgi:ATP-dependent DNA helicase RecQ
MRKEPKKAATSRSAGGGGRGERKPKTAVAELPTELQPAFEALRTWRGEQAREQGVPAYVIFHDATLREIVSVWPGSVAELGGISGVGEKKLATYGEGVLKALAALGGAPVSGAAAGPGPTGSDSESTEPGPGSGQMGPDDWPEMEMEPEPEDWM